MPQAVVITRPFYDPATSYLYKWGEKIVDLAKSLVGRIADLKENRASRKELESVVRKLQPEVIIIYGHGFSDRVFGQDGNVLIKVGENESILKNSNVFSLTCDSGKILGPASIVAGANGYIGYSEPFVFVTSHGYATRADQDPLAKLFLDPTNEIAASLIKGNTVRNANDKGINLFIKNYETVLLSNSKDEYLARFLAWDIRNQVCYDN